MPRLSEDEVIHRILPNLRPQWSYVSTFGRDQRRWVNISCERHGEFQILFDRLLKKPVGIGRAIGCEECILDDIREEFTERFNGHYTYGEIFSRDGFRWIRVHCPKHGWWEQRVTSHRRGHGCGVCAREALETSFPESASKGVLYIASVLKDWGVKYQGGENISEEFIIPNSNGKRFDFYLPDYGLFIEFHGEQHYKGWKGKEENLKKKQANDQWKEDWVNRQPDFDLMVISYKDIDDIEPILSEALGRY